MQAKIDELRPKTCIAVAFLYAILCNYTDNSKTKGGIRTFDVSNDGSTMRDIYSLA